MSRLEAVVRVLKATGRALHYDIITRQALQQGIIRFTGSQGTAGESMKVSTVGTFLLKLANLQRNIRLQTTASCLSTIVMHDIVHTSSLTKCISPLQAFLNKTIRENKSASIVRTQPAFAAGRSAISSPTSFES